MIDLLIYLLYPALKWEQDKWGLWYLLPFAFVAWVADIIIAHTTWALVFGQPKNGELTISHTLERLIFDEEQSDLAIPIAKRINRISNNHIQGLSKAIHKVPNV